MAERDAAGVLLGTALKADRLAARFCACGVKYNR
jgi:hypothetical protein